MVCPAPPRMPEIWLGYGGAEVVMDVRAENLQGTVSPAGEAMPREKLAELVSQLDLKGAEIAALDGAQGTRLAVSAILDECEKRGLPRPRISADARAAGMLEVPGAGAVSGPSEGLLFVGEAGMDGLLGFRTVATRLLRRFGQEHMLSAFAKRDGNMPSPGKASRGFEEARRFADSFEVSCIDVVGGSGGIVDAAVGHPSETTRVCSALEGSAVSDAPKCGALAVSPGPGSGTDDLAGALQSLWNCHAGAADGGTVVLFAESSGGLGAEALRRFVEGRLDADRIPSAPAYVEGMEDLMYLSGVRGRVQACLVSALPDLYAKKLGMVPLGGARQALAHILKSKGARQKVLVVTDGSRVLMR